MMAYPPISEENWLLIDEMCNGTIDAEGMQQLEAAMQDDPEAQQFYVEYCQIQTEVAIAQAVNRAVNAIRQGKSFNSNQKECNSNATVLGFLAGTMKNTGNYLSKPTPLSLAIAMLFVVSLLTTLALVFPASDGTAVVDKFPDNPITKPIVAAVLSDSHDLIWANEQTTRGLGQTIFSGERLELASGLAKVNFNSGANIVLQGPATFIVTGKNSGVLLAGAMHANVPHEAHGFTVNAKAARLVDLGTEFGAKVDEENVTFVHVFDGKVEVALKNLSGEIREEGKRILLAGDSMKINPSGNAITLQPNEVDFSFHKKLQRDHTLDVTDNLALWFSADRAIRKYNTHQVREWGDVRTSQRSIGNIAAQQNAECYPFWKAKGLNGRPSIYFNGKSTVLNTAKTETSASQTILVVFSRSAYPRTESYRGSLFHKSGQVDLVLEERGEYIIQGKLFRKDGVGNFSKTTSKKIPLNQAVICVYRVNAVQHEANLFVNGSLHEKAVVPEMNKQKKAIYSIGARLGKQKHFRGHIAEILIYNAALSDSELNQAGKYLSIKYEVPWEMKQEASSTQPHSKN